MESWVFVLEKIKHMLVTLRLSFFFVVEGIKSNFAKLSVLFRKYHFQKSLLGRAKIKDMRTLASNCTRLFDDREDV